MNTRRDFLKKLGKMGVLISTGQIVTACSNKNVWPKYRVEPLTRGPKNHFFGYYGICPWNKSQTYLLSLETNFQDRMPDVCDSAGIGLVDVKTGRYEKITETKAWNFQQGAFLHWNPLKPDSEIFYNDRKGNEIISICLDINTGKKRILPRPINGISHNGKYALSLNYGRLGRMRKVVGYANVVDPYADEPHPDKDGVFIMDLQTGEYKLVVSIKQVYEMLKNAHPELKHKHMWFNHTVFNKNDTRFFFLARARTNNGKETGMFTVGIDGSELREVIPYGCGVSHFDWRNDKEIIATFRLDSSGMHHYLFVDGVNKYKRLGNGCLDFDGHCTFSPDQKWIATDHKMGKILKQSLILYNLEMDSCKTLVTLSMKDRMFISGELRCDFHPRWNWDGTAICFDAIDSRDGSRQLHVAYLDFS